MGYQFDDLAKDLARGTSRRRMLGRLLGDAVGAVTASLLSGRRAPVVKAALDPSSTMWRAPRSGEALRQATTQTSCGGALTAPSYQTPQFNQTSSSSQTGQTGTPTSSGGTSTGTSQSAPTPDTTLGPGRFVPTFRRGSTYEEGQPFLSWKLETDIGSGWIALPFLQLRQLAGNPTEVTDSSFTYRRRADGTWVAIRKAGAPGVNQDEATADGGLQRFFDPEFRYDAGQGLRWIATPRSALLPAQQPTPREGDKDYCGSARCFYRGPDDSWIAIPRKRAADGSTVEGNEPDGD